MTDSSESENGFVKVTPPKTSPDNSSGSPTSPLDTTLTEDQVHLLEVPRTPYPKSFTDTYSEPSRSPDRTLQSPRPTVHRRSQLDLLRHEASRFLERPISAKPIAKGRLQPRRSLAVSMQDAPLDDFNFDDTEYTLRIPLPGADPALPLEAPTRKHFEYVYRNIHDPACQTYLTNIQPWLQHNISLKRQDPSRPVLDRDGSSHNIPPNLHDVLNLPENRKFLEKKKTTTPITSIPFSFTTTTVSQATATQGAAGGIISPHTPPQSPARSPPSTPSNSPHSSPPSSPDMTGLREKSVFFPSATFDGKDKSLTRAHWQSFRDFVDRQTWASRNADENFEEQLRYFKMTLRDLARLWFESNTFTDLKDLAHKFLTEFSPYGKRQRDWLHQWVNLKFNPDTDNIDEYIQKFRDLAQLLNYPEAHQVQIFKMAMPPTVELQLRSIDNLEQLLRDAKECLSICQVNATATKLSTLALARSPSPSPTRTRSPSPILKSTIGPRQSRPRQTASRQPPFSGFRQYPGRMQSRPRSSSRPRSFSRPRPGPPTRQRIPTNQYRFRPRSISRSRNPFRPGPTCFYCGIRGHTINVCRKRMRNQTFSNRFRSNRSTQPRTTIQRYQDNRPQSYSYSDDTFQDSAYRQNTYSDHPSSNNPPFYPTSQDRHISWRTPLADNSASDDPDLNP